MFSLYFLYGLDLEWGYGINKVTVSTFSDGSSAEINRKAVSKHASSQTISVDFEVVVVQWCE